MRFALQRFVRPTAPLPTSGPVLRAVVEARDRAQALLSGDRLPALASELAAEAIGRGHRHLFAASSAGFCVVGAMIVHEPRLTLYREGDHVRVLLLDVAVAMTSGLELTASQLRATGATEVDTLIATGMATVESRLALAS